MMEAGGVTPVLGPGVAQTYVTLALPEILEAHGAEDLHRQMLDKLSAGLPIKIDGNLVHRIATPCLQVIIAAARSAKSRQLSFEMNSPSAALLDAFVQLGLQHDLAL